MADAAVTVFGTPKPCAGAFARIQRNAIWSWRELGPAADVLVVGDDAGVAELAAELGVAHEPQVARSPHRVPLLDDLWAVGQRRARTPLCLFANCDIVLTDDLVPALDAVRAQLDGPFLAVGQRWDLDLGLDLPEAAGDDRHGVPWGVALRRRARREGRLNSPLWVDWFAFPTGQYPALPACAIGRPGYDHWLVWHTLERAIPVVDVTDAVTAVHQHHDYSHGGGKQSVWHGDDAQRNLALTGGRPHMRHIGHATHRLDASLRLGPARGPKYVLSRAHTHLGPVLERTAGWRHRAGLDAEALQRLGERRRRTRARA